MSGSLVLTEIQIQIREISVIPWRKYRSLNSLHLQRNAKFTRNILKIDFSNKCVCIFFKN